MRIEPGPAQLESPKLVYSKVGPRVVAKRRKESRGESEGSGELIWHQIQGMKTPEQFNQQAAYRFAVFAVVLFTVFEHGLTGINGLATIDFYLAFRAVVTSAFFIVLFAVPRRESIPHPCLNPFALTQIVWARAAVTVAYLSALAIALAIGGTQASVYPLFLLHPLWQVMVHRLIAREWDITFGQVIGLAVVASGAVLYALSCGALHGTKLTALAQLAAFIAGAGFALSNELGSAITATPRSSVLCNERYMNTGNMSSLEASAYNTVASVWLLIPMLPLIWSVLKIFNLQTMWNIAPWAVDAHVIWLLIAGCAIITGGTWLFAQAMKLAASKPPVAAVDALILPFGIGLDWYSGKLLTSSSVFLWMMVSTALIVCGVAWAAACEEQNPGSGRPNDKTSP
jgi:hypothetical protein